MRKKPELLIPASSLEVLKTAVMFGADAVYIGGEAYGLRAKAKNFSMEDMQEGIAFAHAHGVRVHVTANILAHNDDLLGARHYFEELKALKPDALIDAILAKRNLGTSRNMAPLTIGLGPGFFAGEDVDYVVETMRGHDLARIITEGPAIPNTGVPGMVGGVSKERVIHSPGVGRIHNMVHIADIVEKGQILAYVGETPVEASITGVLRGIIKEGYNVPVGMKIADIDPRKEEKKNCFTISDKARCIAGSVVEILLSEGVLPNTL